MLIPETVLVAGEGFGARLPAEQVVVAIGRGLRAGGSADPDLCPIEQTPRHGAGTRSARATREGQELRRLLDALDLDARLRDARALVVTAARLDRSSLSGSSAFELATRARQGGVPAYAVSAKSRLSLFDARMLDLQAILTAGDTRSLSAAGRKLARLV